MFIWEFKEAIKRSDNSCHDIQHHKVKKEYFTSLTKCRREVWERMDKEYKDPKCVYKENWIEKDEVCMVFNLGGNIVFSYKRIEVK